MAAGALHGWPHAVQKPQYHQRPPQQSRRFSHHEAHRFSSDPHPKTSFARLQRLPGPAAAASHEAADVTKPVIHPEPRSWPSQQPPLQGRLRPPRRSVFDSESRSGSEQGLTPDASPRDPSPKPPMSLAARRALTKELPPPNGNLRSLDPTIFGMSRATAAAPPGGALYLRRLTQPRLAAESAARGNFGKTGHSVWRSRRHR